MLNNVSCSAPTGSRGAQRDTSPIARSSAGTEARLDIPELGTAVDVYFHNGLTDSTRKTYASAQKKFKEFCADQGLPPAPASEPTLCRYVAHLVQGGTAHSSIKCYLAAVRQYHIAGGWNDPGISQMPRLVQVLRGVKTVQARRGNHQGRNRLPITPELLRKMREVWNRTDDPRKSKMMWAAAALCFFGFFRSGEITVPTTDTFDPGAHLTFQDVQVDDRRRPQALRIRLKSSKTDPFRVGVDVYVGHTQDELCPVAAVLSYMVARGAGPGPFFCYGDSRPLTRAKLVAETKEALSKAGVDSSCYSGHSFRKGAATTAASQGIGDATIMMLGRWQSSAYQRYVNTPREQLAGISKRLVTKF